MMRTLRIRLPRITAAAALPCLLLLGACDTDRRGAGEAGEIADIPREQRYGGTITIATIGDMPNMNPLVSSDHNTNQYHMFVMNTPLLRMDESFELQPWGARSWELSEDGTVLTFHLRNDIHWHDGPKTTAYDWKFSYELARDPATAFPNSSFWVHYGDAEAVDSFTFRIRLTPHAEYLDPWRTFTAVPQHVLQGVAATDMRNHPYGTTNPVGNGPFRFASRQPGQNWIFDANPDYPAELGGRPYADRIVYRIIPEPTTLLTELLTGRIDYYIGPPASQVEQLRNAPNARLLTFQDRAYVLIGWNQRRPLFADARVRRALTMGIDRQAIIDGVMRGHGTVANSTVPPIFWQFDPEAGADLVYNPDGARQLLAEAGWTPGPDGMLRNAQGQQFRFELVTNQGNQVRGDIIQIVQAQLRQIGVDVQPRVQEWGTLLTRLNDVQRRDFDAVVIGWVTEFRVDDMNLFHCGKLDTPYQWAGHCDAETDRLLDQLPLIPDRDQARPVWSQYQRRIAELQPYTFIYFQERLEGVSNRLLNVAPDARGDLVGIDRWVVHPEQRGRGGPAAAQPGTGQ
jgi:peptide/nickel transport system substrate-binding protein